ncbi:WecB/TagA/CpsF family glycosyltransferase [Shewanella sp. WXL01]|uniref:WecB/TagA/CpsF family glycosyltransferase n=1 Tax=Shewanella sp. WXL01 TaxID=2709721 RepID=UPI0014385505|nr:WecB/TagA/CpsF family glycosyltransferase [Shewanella sp. WXL01]NKF51716.1 WecB/TagA/CpsF family glycosyltransferase [Shewanella sp. WXL01]
MRTHINQIAFSIRVFEIISAMMLLIVLSPLLIVKALYLLARGEQVFEQIQFHGHMNMFNQYQFTRGRFSGILHLYNVLTGDMGYVGSRAQYAVIEATPYTVRPGLMSFEKMHQQMGICYDKFTDDPHLNHSIGNYLVTLGRCIIGYALASTKSKLSIEPQVMTEPQTGPKPVENKFEIFKVCIDNLTMTQAINSVVNTAKDTQPNIFEGLSSTPNQCQQFCFVNTDCLNTAYKDDVYRQTLAQANKVFADGSGIRLASKLLGFTVKDNVNGTDMLPLLCQKAAKQQLPLFLLGAKPGVAQQAANKLVAAHPGLKIAGTQDGYFDEAKVDEVIATINQSGAKILLVAMGAPAQDNWIAKYQHRLQVPVAMGVGGLFDFYAERVSRAPVAIRQIGMEWTWRLMQEPVRMWRRYLIGNPLFVLRVIETKFKLKTGLEAVSKALSTTSTPQSDDEKVGNAIETNPIGHFSHHKLKYASRRKQRYYLKLLAAKVAKRSFDIVASAILMLLLSPLLLITALLIRIESPGAILFTQTRAGLNNQPFTMWKFRSMFIDAEARLAKLQQQNEMRGGVIFKMKSDPRVTRVGRFIRKASIDELPQLWNVFIGEMSLVGPRPALPSEVSQYQPSDHRRLLTKPGITCIWQVSGRSDIPFDRQVELDVDYLYKQSFTQDFKLLLKTIPAVLFARGAY